MWSYRATDSDKWYRYHACLEALVGPLFEEYEVTDRFKKVLGSVAGRRLTFNELSGKPVT